MLRALAFFKGQNPDPSRRQNSIKLMENVGLAKSGRVSLYIWGYQSWSRQRGWHHQWVHQFTGVQTHVHKAWMNTTCNSCVRKFPGFCAQITSYWEVKIQPLHPARDPPDKLISVGVYLPLIQSLPVSGWEPDELINLHMQVCRINFFLICF